jgi:hypothetical protein
VGRLSSPWFLSGQLPSLRSYRSHPCRFRASAGSSPPKAAAPTGAGTWVHLASVACCCSCSRCVCRTHADGLHVCVVFTCRCASDALGSRVFATQQRVRACTCSSNNCWRRGDSRESDAVWGSRHCCVRSTLGLRNSTPSSKTVEVIGAVGRRMRAGWGGDVSVKTIVGGVMTSCLGYQCGAFTTLDVAPWQRSAPRHWDRQTGHPWTSRTRRPRASHPKPLADTHVSQQGCQQPQQANGQGGADARARGHEHQ